MVFVVPEIAMSEPNDQATTTIPVIEEQLQVSRREVETGRALRLRKQVDEEPVEVHQNLQRDVIETLRVPIGRVVEGPVGIRHEGDVTIVPVLQERLVTHTELVLVEEIHIRRRTEVREERGQVNLRRERVVIERLDPDTQQWLPEEGS
jgi:stress response protein YsnF